MPICPKRNPLRLLPLALALGAALPVRAESLLELYTLARGFDAAYQSALAQYDANIARSDQALANLLPSASLSAGASRSNLVNNNPVVDRTFGTQNATLAASQPLYRPVNVVNYEQGRKLLESSQAQLVAAEQDLIVRVGQAYFDVLGAQDTLVFVQAQKSAISEQLAAAKRNFEVGTSTITDTREAQARFDLVTAQEIAAENDLRVKRIALDQLVGKTGVSPNPVVAPLALPTPEPANAEAWVTNSVNTHPTIRQARTNLEVAELEVKKAEAGHKPTVDLQASYTVTNNFNGSTTSGATGPNFQTRLGSVGLVFNMPLFAGFAVQNRVRETLSLAEKARDDLDNATRTVAQSTRTAFFGVMSGMSSVKALEAAEASSQSALEANRLGYQVGVRINIDVLNSQSQLFQTKRDLAAARYNVLMGNLRLRQAGGVLGLDDLTRINALVAPSTGSSAVKP